MLKYYTGKTRTTHYGSKKSLNRLVLEKYTKKALSLNNLLELLQVSEDIISVSGCDTVIWLLSI